MSRCFETGICIVTGSLFFALLAFGSKNKTKFLKCSHIYVKIYAENTITLLQGIVL